MKNQEMSRRDRICRKVIEYGILGLIIFSPLPAASVYDWSIFVMQIAVILMMMAYFFMKEKPQTNEYLALSLRWPRIFFLGLFSLIFLQILPFPKLIVRFFSPSAYSFLKQYAIDFSDIKFMSFSLIPHHTLREGLELLTYFLVGFLILKTVTERAQIIRIFSVLVALGTFEAFYGMFELYNKNPRILFYKKIHYLDSLTGTFVNRNHLSGYLEMVIPLAVGLIIARARFFLKGGSRCKGIVLRLSEKGFSTNILLSMTVIVMSLGIIFSKSRSGIFLLVFSFILFFGLTVLYLRIGSYHNKWIRSFIVIVFLVIIFISLYLGIDATLERFSPDRIISAQRPIFWAHTLGIFADFPLTGTGLGTFTSLYPDWDTGEKLVRLYHAHNDYLEYLSELGFFGFIFLFGLVLYMLVKSLLIWRERRHPEVKGLALGGLIAVICILIHSITDFNLHIPANMLLFSIVLSITMVTVFHKKRSENQKG